MLAALNVPALLIGIAGGGLTATILSLLLGGVLSVADLPFGAEIGLLFGVLAGLVFGGLIAGRLALHSHRFHGSIVGLALAAVLIFLSRGATGISVLSVVTLALVSVLVGGLGGWIGGRRRPVSQ